MADKDNLAESQILNLAYDETGAHLRVFLVGGSAGAPPAATPVRDTDTGAGAVDFTTAVASKWEPHQVNIHASASVAEVLTIKFKSKTGAGYETLLYSFSAGWTDLVWSPDNNRVYDNGDELHIECANTGAKTISIDVVGVEVT